MAACRGDLKRTFRHVVAGDVAKIKLLGLFGRQCAAKFSEPPTTQLSERFDDVPPYALYPTGTFLSSADKGISLALSAQRICEQAGDRPYNPFQGQFAREQRTIEHRRPHLARSAQQAYGYGKVEP